jgi:hypothetical protein
MIRGESSIDRTWTAGVSRMSRLLPVDFAFAGAVARASRPPSWRRRWSWSGWSEDEWVPKRRRKGKKEEK